MSTYVTKEALEKTITLQKGYIDDAVEEVNKTITEKHAAAPLIPNLLLATNVTHENKSYNIVDYYFDEDVTMVKGDTYTLQMWGVVLGEGNTKLVVYNSNGNVTAGATILPADIDEDGYVCKQFKWNSSSNYTDQDTKVKFYAYPSSATTTSKIERVMLTKGTDVPPWAPARSELAQLIDTDGAAFNSHLRALYNTVVRPNKALMLPKASYFFLYLRNGFLPETTKISASSGIVGDLLWYYYHNLGGTLYVNSFNAIDKKYTWLKALKDSERPTVGTRFLLANGVANTSALGTNLYGLNGHYTDTSYDWLGNKNPNTVALFEQSKEKCVWIKSTETAISNTKVTIGTKLMDDIYGYEYTVLRTYPSSGWICMSCTTDAANNAEEYKDDINFETSDTCLAVSFSDLLIANANPVLHKDTTTLAKLCGVTATNPCIISYNYAEFAYTATDTAIATMTAGTTPLIIVGVPFFNAYVNTSHNTNKQDAGVIGQLAIWNWINKLYNGYVDDDDNNYLCPLQYLIPVNLNTFNETATELTSTGSYRVATIINNII